MIIKRFIQQVKRYPDKCAVKGSDKEISYTQLHQRTDYIAAFISNKLAGTKEQPTALLLEHGVDMIAGVLATLKSGNIYVPFDPAYPEKRLLYMLEDSGAKLLVTNTANLPKAQSLAESMAADKKVEILNMDAIDTAGPAPQMDESVYDKDGIAYLLYTSGSTGKPKGVIQSHKNVLHFITCYTANLEITEKDRLTLFSAFSHDAAVMDIYTALLSGATLYPLNIKEADITEIAHWLKAEEITVWHSVPTIYRYFVNTLTGREKFPHLRFLVMGGEAVLPEDVYRFKKLFPDSIFVNLYGQSESSYNSTQFFAAFTPFDKVLLGIAIDGVTLMVVDEEGEEVAPFREGEIVVVNNYSALGYWKDKEKTEQAFMEDEEIGRLYWTGDRGRLLLDGQIEFTGRVDFQIKIRGYRVELGEIETALLSHDTVEETVVVAPEQADGQKVLCAYVVPAADKKITIHELREFLGQEVMEHMIPSYFVQLDKLPVTPTGKIDRKALPEIEGRIMTGAEYAAPTDKVEENLVAIWREVLNQPKVGIDDHFFDIGGHSLRATVLAARVHKTMQIEFPLKEIFRAPTVRAMARYVRNAEAAGYSEMPKAKERDFYPLSSAQKRMFLLTGIEGEGTGYNISKMVEISGLLDKEKLEKAFAQLMARHDSLRTSFHMEMGQPVQVVHKELPFAFDEVEDVSPGQGDASLVLLKKFVRPFDLTKAPLLRAGLVELQAGTHLLMMDMHHIISDGTSMGIIAGELAQLYAGESLPDLRVQYKDFAFRQNGVFATGVVDGLREYWQEVFPGDVPLLDLPIDWERPEIQSFKGGSLNLQLDPESTSRLKEIASGCKTSLFMVLLAIYNVMLSIYGRCEDVVVGTPTAGRSHPDLEHMVGMFVNTLALRNFPKGELTFTAFLEDVKKHVLDAFVNQDFQFEELVDMLEIRRDLGRNPLFDTVFTLQNIEMPEIKTENLVFKQVEYEDDIAKFDVMLTAYETEEGMGMDLQYCSALFKRETVERMAGHFLNIIRDVSADPLIRLNTVSMLSEAERHLLVVTFNDTETEYPSDKTLHGIFSEQAAATPANFALSGPNNAGTEDSLFYYELNEKTEHLGLLLREKGVGPGQIVGILMDRTVEMVVGILAVLKAGGAYMPLDPEYPVDRISFMLKDSAAPVLLTSRAVYGDGSLVGDWQGELGFIGDYEELVSVSYATGGKALPSPAKPDDLAYVIYTSGTTGRPKGVLVDHRNVVRLMKNRSFQFDFREGDVWTVFHSFCFDFSVWEMYGALLYGGKLVIIPKMLTRDPAAFLEILKKEKVTVLNQSPSAFYQLMREALKKPDAPDAPASAQEETPEGQSDSLKLRYVIFGAEALKPGQLKEWHHRYPETRLINMYGITETTVHVTFKEITESDIAANSAGIGKPLPTLSTYIVDKWQRLLPLGTAGELCVGGEGVARGYLNRPELTAEKFLHYEEGEHPVEGEIHYVGGFTHHVEDVVDLADGSRGGTFYRSGDLARMRESGELEYLGRIDQQVKIRGFRIELGEIENQLMQHEEIKNAVAIPRTVDADAYICAYVVPVNPVVEQKHLIARLREHLARSLPSYMIPSYFVLMEKIPLTSNGKVDRKALPEPEVISTRIYKAPRNLLEERLVESWAAVLRVDSAQIGIEDNFFEMGGHSLKAAALSARVLKKLNIPLPLREIFKSPTVTLMAAYLKERKEVEYTAMVPTAERPYYPLTPAQRRLFTLRQMESGGSGTAYNITSMVRVIGALDEDKIQRVFRQLVNRHESLRTVFETVGGEPVARILPEADIPLETFETDKIEIAKRDFIRPFDFNRAPLIRVGTIKSPGDAGSCLLMMDMHHIVSDGISMGIITRELMDAYEGRELPELRLQYKDYAVWQEELAGKGILGEQERYWLEAFSDQLPVLDIRTDFPRPSVQHFEGRSIDFSINETLTEKLKAIAADEGATLYMVLLGLYNVLLSRYGKVEDVIVGTPTAGRRDADLEYIVGMFVNTLALRNFPVIDKPFAAGTSKETLNLSPHAAPVFRQGEVGFLEDLKERTLAAFDNQDFQFEDLVEKLELRRDLSRSPLFDTMFSFQDFDIPDLELEGLTFQHSEFENPVAKFDLTLTGSESEGRLHFAFQYATALFEEETIRRMAGHLKNLVSSAASDPSVAIGRLEMISADERKQILVDFNDTASDFPETKTIIQLFTEQAARTPGSVAVKGADLYGAVNTSLTYGDLLDQSYCLACTLAGKGVGPGKTAAVMSGQIVEMVPAILGILRTGAAYVPIDPHYPAERIAYMLEDSGADIFLTSAEAAKNCTYKKEIFHLEHIKDLEETDNPLPVTEPSGTAYIIYTSGSTGKPKGVITGHRALVNMCWWNKSYFKLKPSDHMTKYVGFGFDVSLWEIFPTLAAGACLCIVPDDIRLDVEKLNEFYEAEGVTVSFLPPQIAERFMAGVDNGSLRILQVGGDKLRDYVPRNYQVVNLYGPTEYAVVTSSFPIEGRHHNIPIGKPVSNTSLYVLDKNREVLPVGVPGELYISGDGLAQGYLNRPDLTPAAFVPNPFEAGEQMYKTGDLVSWSPDGNIHFLGRLDFQVKIRGFRIELGEIETAVLAHQSVKGAVVVTGEEEPGHFYLCAYVVPAADVSWETLVPVLRETLGRSLPDYMIPAYFVHMEALPLNAAGKVNRDKLPEPETAERATGVEFQAPRNDSEQKIADIYGDLLRLEKVGIDDDFFRLGGHSLKATQLVGNIHKLLNVSIPLTEVFKSPTVRALSQKVAELSALPQTGDFAAIEKTPQQEYYQLSSIQRRMYLAQVTAPGNTSYNLPVVTELEGPLDREHLTDIMQQLVNRHESFRTSFVSIDAVPMQKILPRVRMEMEYYEVEGTDAQKKEKIEELLEAFIRPFDMLKPPHIRAGLVKRERHRFILMLDMHHIISDGSSFNVLLEEFMTLYEGKTLSPLRLQYKDFAAWQESEARQAEIKKQALYWLQLYRKTSQTLQLPLDFPRPAVKGFSGLHHHFFIDRQTTDKLNELAKQEGSTLFMILLALYNILLSQLTGQEDVVVGTSIAGRRHADLQPIVGMFVNALALRNFPAGDKTFSGFLKELRDNTLGAYENQDYSFEELVDFAGGSRDPGRNPIFDTMFILNNEEDLDEFRIPGLTLKACEEFKHTSAQMDIKFRVREADHGLTLAYEYSTALFKPATMEMFAKNFNEVVAAVLENPGTLLKDISITHGLVAVEEDISDIDFDF